ncbi:hypothetical protein LT85_0283 [Collimonas arenae]|uniref:Uncharacterized protein n=1 Tax=Collimonas arenae TaxID=279058 RepID=A0A0A1F3Z3_9BURK|nr:hypothetical protein LT85_0283 [Collimonas arenae]
MTLTVFGKSITTEIDTWLQDGAGETMRLVSLIFNYVGNIAGVTTPIAFGYRSAISFLNFVLFSSK